MEAVGPRVTDFSLGDHVIACLSVFCGKCDFCLSGQTHLCRSRDVRRGRDEPPKYTWQGQEVAQFANLSSYAEQMLVFENALVKIRDDMPLNQAALIGCGVTTGVGGVEHGQGRAGLDSLGLRRGRRGPLRDSGIADRRGADDHRR